MKAGTATKMVLNMISTATMIQLGKIYGNLMVDLMAVNDKMVDRGTRIIAQLTGLEYDAAKVRGLKRTNLSKQLLLWFTRTAVKPKRLKDLKKQAGCCGK